MYSNLKPKDRVKMLQLDATVVACNHGYKHAKGASELNGIWNKRLKAAFKAGADTNPLKAKHTGAALFTLTSLRRTTLDTFAASIGKYAERIIGNQSRYEDLARAMDAKSAVDKEGRPETKFNKDNFYCWVYKPGDKEMFPMEKSYLSSK